ncbi:MAG TPA: vWA domain-containing protein [Thermoanaerobaculia bacterium]
MRRRFVPAAVLVFISLVAQAQQRGAVDWIFLVDTSKSMRGVGSQNIFPDVKASIDSFIRRTNDGDSVAIFTFDRDVRLHSATDIHGAARDDLTSIVDGLDAEGTRTHLGLAIERGLERAESLRKAKDPSRAQAVVLLTDGKEDVRGIDNPVPISSSLRRVGETYVFFVSMGEHEHETQLDDFATEVPRARVLRAPTPEAIGRVADEIRTAVVPPPPPPAKRRVALRAPVDQEPKASPFRWLILLLILAGAAVAIFLSQRHKNGLEGELEIVQPRVTPESAFVGLSRLAKNEVSLSALLPPESLDGGDARLFVRRTNGVKKVWIAAQSGTLRVNDIETPASELFDADVIQLGTTKVRFNRAGFERQEES